MHCSELKKNLYCLYIILKFFISITDTGILDPKYLMKRPVPVHPARWHTIFIRTENVYVRTKDPSDQLSLMIKFIVQPYTATGKKLASTELDLPILAQIVNGKFPSILPDILICSFLTVLDIYTKPNCRHGSFHFYNYVKRSISCLGIGSKYWLEVVKPCFIRNGYW